jgi:hypothetical protein
VGKGRKGRGREYGRGEALGRGKGEGGGGRGREKWRELVPVRLSFSRISIKKSLLCWTDNHMIFT